MIDSWKITVMVVLDLSKLLLQCGNVAECVI